MTPRQRVEAALRGERTDKVPFTVYDWMVPRCSAERELRERGLCLLVPTMGSQYGASSIRGRKYDAAVVTTHRPNVKVSERTYTEDGRRFTRTVYETPVGSVSTLGEYGGFTTWRREKMFKTPDDYGTILFLIRDDRYEPNYEAFARAEREYGEDGIFRAAIGLEPLQQLISGTIFRMEDFCIEWLENRDEILKLYEAIVENRRKVYPLVAQSPAFHANYGGNVVPEVIGLETFERYYVPHYNEAAEIMHRRGKLIGCHYDANCRLLADAIARTDLDYIEAFTPAPDTDMTLREAREAWPDKVLWLNFPSSLHLKSDEEIELATVDLLDQAGGVDGLIMGVTEDMPPWRCPGSCKAIMDGIDRHAREHPELYS